jgi:cell shape-determining protein MreC
VARITQVEFEPSSPFARIIAQPTTDLDRIREVLLVVSEPVPDPDSMPVGPYKTP